MTDEEIREPCPTPLSWQDVVETFRTESEPWEHDGGRLKGAIWGDGPPLYFLNGFTGNHELFSLSAFVLRDYFRCVLFDYAGSERDRVSEHPTSINEIADDVLRIADTLHDDQFCLYSAPFGTPAAIQLMLNAPDRVERAVLQTPFAVARKYSLAERLMIRIGSRLKFPIGRIPAFRRLQAVNHASWFPPYDFSRWKFFAENTGHSPIATLAHRAALLRSVDFADRLREVDTPTLLLRAEGEGPRAAALADDVENQIPNATTEWLHTTGHTVFLTHPHRLAKLVRPFCLGEELVSESDRSTSAVDRAAENPQPVATDSAPLSGTKEPHVG